MIEKKIFVFLLLAVFLISFTSAAEWDNALTDYNQDEEIITFSNGCLFDIGWTCTGDEIGKVQLKTSKDFKVAPGYNYVWELDTWLSDDESYNDFLKGFEYEDMNNGKKKVNRDLDIKMFKGMINVTRDTYGCLEEDTSENGTKICIDHGVNGSRLEEVENWTEVTSANLKKANGKVTLRGYTNVEIGDYIDWSPVIFGVRVSHNIWATWTADLNVGLVSFYKLNDNAANTNVNDSINTNEGTLVGGNNTEDISTTAKIGNGLHLDGSVDNINLGTMGSFGSNLNNGITIATWINTTDIGGSQNGVINDGTSTLATIDWNFGLTGTVGFSLRDNSGNFLNGRTTLDTGFNDGDLHLVIVSANGPANIINVTVDNIDYAITYASQNTPSSFINFNHNFLIGAMDNRGTITSYFNAIFNQFGIWNRTLNQSEKNQLWNDGDGITWTDKLISISLNDPENASLSNDATVDFNWTIIPISFNITNWTLNVWYGNGTLAHQHINTTINTDEETTVIHNDTLFLDESYIWNVESCLSEGTCDTSANWTFTLDTTPPIVNITYPPEGFIINTPQENITLNYTVFHPVGDLSNCFYNTSSNSTPVNISCTTNTTSLLFPITNPDNLTIYVYANDTASNLGSDNVTIYKDTTAPLINVTTPSGTLGYNRIGGNETLNVTLSDSSLDSCWYNYNGTNITIEGCLTGIENSTQFILEQGNFNVTIYANDSIGNLNSTSVEWDYTILEYSTTYDSEITEGETNQISTKIVISEGESITSSVLNYNDTNYTTSIGYDGENYTIISSNDALVVDSDTNFSFNFIISLDGVDYNTTTNNQTVSNLDFSICGGVSNDTLLNMSLFDEGTLLSLTGDMEFNADIISKSSEEIIETINGTFNNTNSGTICFSPVSSYNLYYLDVEIRYFSDDYVTEFYYIQKADLGGYPKNLSLFDLNQSDSTKFSVTYKNNAFIFIEDAIIQLQRKYIGESTYRVVEAPLTSDGGKTILHIDLNTNKYRASVVKNGELLDFFENIVFSCENELSGDCTYSLDGTVDPNNDVPIEEITDFSYSVSIDEDNQTVTVLFAVPSGTPATIGVSLNQIDMFGNLTSCNTTIITSAGSITCDYTDTIEKSILELSISKDDVQLAVLSYVNDPDLDMDGMNFFIVFLFMISLAGMAIASPEWMIIISVMVLIISGTMLLLKGMSLVMGLGAIAWVVIAAAIIIMKMAKQEDR